MINKSKHKFYTNCGFTLIEMSIVLVIIGMILAAVLVGQDLVRSSEVRSLISQIDKTNAAVNAFKIKYRYFPGDYPFASRYLSSQGGAITINNGDGNQLIATGKPVAVPTLIETEMAGFWAHLSSENLVEGTYDGTFTTTTLGKNFPFTTINKGGILAFGNLYAANFYNLGLANSANTTIITALNLSANAAYQMDSKTDNGYPYSGNVIARGVPTLNDSGTTSATLGTAARCIYSTPNPAIYMGGAGSSLACILQIKML